MTLVTTDHSQSKRYWIIKADNEFDFDTDEPLYWCNIEGWVLLENCQRFSEEDAKKFPWAVDGGEWVSEVAPFDLPDTDCRHCGERIHMKGVYVDSTGGDVCCADKFTEKNENGQHQP